MDELDILLVRSYNGDRVRRRQQIDSEDTIVEKLTGLLNHSRLSHSLGVRDTCADLAARYGADLLKARVAGLVHDCARDLDDHQLMKAAKQYGINANQWATENLLLLHGPVGAFLARDLFGVEDTEILHAVAVHTTGCAGMRLMDLVLFVADYIEPNRTFPGVGEIRLAAKRSLELAALRGCKATMRHLLQSDRLIHPRTLEARNDLLTRILESTARGPVRSDEFGRRG